MDDATRLWEANVHFDGVTPLVSADYEHCTYPLCVLHRETVAPLESARRTRRVRTPRRRSRSASCLPFPRSGGC